MEERLRCLELIRSRRKFVLTTHISSDGDGVGSQLAFARGLLSLGAQVAIINPTPLPNNLKFLLKYSGEIHTPAELKYPDESFMGALTIVLDMGAFERLGTILPYAGRSEGILVIDHHRMERRGGVYYLLDTEACATAEITAGLLGDLGVELTPEIAEPLYVGLHTDTGGFRYPGTTAETHRLVARLLDTGGVDPQKLYTEVYEKVSIARLKLTGGVLSTIEVSPAGKVAWIQMRSSMLERAGASISDADDLVGYTLKLDGVVAGFYFKELNTGMTKVSCRSRGDFAIDRFVKKWGGGGHPHAAGVRMGESIDEAMGIVIQRAIRELEGAE